MKLSSVVSSAALVLVLLLFAVSSSVAQRELIDRDNRGTAIELGYSRTDQIDGFAGAVGLTGDRNLDLGIGVGKFSASRSLDIYAFQVGGDYFFVKNYARNGRLFVSFRVNFLHDWYRYQDHFNNFNRSASGVSLGPTVSFGPRGEKVQLIIFGGIDYLDWSTVEENDHWVKSAGLTVAFKRGGRSWIGLSGGYSNNDS